MEAKADDGGEAIANILRTEVGVFFLQEAHFAGIAVDGPGEGRMAAESVKHVAWKYAVKADPFVAEEGADAEFIGRLNETRKEVSDLALPAAGSDQITPWMKELRTSSFESRRAIYLEQRVEDQRAFRRHRGYRRKYKKECFHLG